MFIGFIWDYEPPILQEYQYNVEGLGPMDLRDYIKLNSMSMENVHNFKKRILKFIVDCDFNHMTSL